MDKTEMIRIIRKEYAEVSKALEKAEKEYDRDKRSIKKRETYQFISAQEMILDDLCCELEIELYDDDFNLIEEWGGKHYAYS